MPMTQKYKLELERERGRANGKSLHNQMHMNVIIAAEKQMNLLRMIWMHRNGINFFVVFRLNPFYLSLCVVYAYFTFSFSDFHLHLKHARVRIGFDMRFNFHQIHEPQLLSSFVLLCAFVFVFYEYS